MDGLGQTFNEAVTFEARSKEERTRDQRLTATRRTFVPRIEPPNLFYSNFLIQINFIITKFLIVGDLPIEFFGWRRSTRVLGIGKESGKGGESSKSHFFSFTKISSFRLFSVVVGFRSGVVRPSSIFFLESDKKNWQRDLPFAGHKTCCQHLTAEEKRELKS